MSLDVAVNNFNNGDFHTKTKLATEVGLTLGTFFVGAGETKFFSVTENIVNTTEKVADVSMLVTAKIQYTKSNLVLGRKMHDAYICYQSMHQNLRALKNLQVLKVFVQTLLILAL